MKLEGVSVKIGTRLVVSLTIAVAIVTGLYLYQQLSAERQALLEQREREIRVMARTLEVAVRNAVRRDQWEDVQELFEEAKGYAGVARVTLFHADGTPLVGGDQEGVEITPGREEFREAIKRKQSMSFSHTLNGEQVLHYLRPIRLINRGPALLEIAYRTSQIESAYLRRRDEIILAGVAIMAAIAMAFWYLTKRNISKPIHALIEGAAAIGAGELDRQIPIARRDELGRLAAEFNRMTERLKQAREQILEETIKKVELERQLQHSEKLAAVGRLAAGLAHEIGTPLNIISGRAEYLLPALSESHPSAQSLRIIVEQIARIRRIIEQLLGYARVTPPHIAPTSLSEVFSNVLSLLDHELTQRSIRVTSRIPDTLPKLAADPYLLEQVFVNLLLNALDAMPEGGQVRVAAEAKRDWIEVSVADTGCGIPPESLPRIFDPFFTTKKVGEGTGLGLSVVYGIVKDHGGTIEVKSEPDEGTTFLITFPVHRSQPVQPASVARR
ncbi:Histidine kinase [Candidatus Methylomirabilis lanthanidiphila]|uniref:histidine kinase n=1 Tax=Candidatus Methylomirabilis lanthanidiphila TaxID=2211376 RepID=A0A564ZI26_9BACT|nr:HAMP domain-containing protein [Candidatus Methylomirabilis lanthanidiphila]VUZ84991.1 Histidine kinase [Candidatus Methylomirabilis lanthanidiphila]